MADALVKPSDDYVRLQQLEQKGIQCVTISAQVAEQLAQFTGHTPEGAAQQAEVVRNLCTEFMRTIRDAHQLIQEGVKAHAGEHKLELHSYHNLGRAHINTEKLQVLRLHLEALQATMKAAGVWAPRVDGRAAGDASGSPPGGARQPPAVAALQQQQQQQQAQPATDPKQQGEGPAAQQHSPGQEAIVAEGDVGAGAGGQQQASSPQQQQQQQPPPAAAAATNPDQDQRMEDAQ